VRGDGGEIVDPTRAERFLPTVYLYDNYPGGVGLSEPLWKRQAELLARARELVAGCACRGGCPGCVGPVLAGDEEAEVTPRALALRVLGLLGAPA
jgi:DEAD/DEAH box helicase domain-containing protein